MLITTLFWIIIAIVVLDFVIERSLDYLNTTTWSSTVPKAVRGIYNPWQYAKQQMYSKVNHRFSMIQSIASFLLILMMLGFGGFGLIDLWVQTISDHAIVCTLLFFGVLAVAADLLSMPFQVYSTFMIESRFGFNKTTLKTFIFDKLKGGLIGGIIGGGLLALLILIWQKTGDWFWILAWALVMCFSLFMLLFYSNIIVPLFNKQTPLNNGPLKSAITTFAVDAGFELDKIFVIDGSKRSTKANAYFTGLGSKKRIVLYDTLIDQLEIDEIVAVLAHEVGHNKHKHTLASFGLSFLQSGLMFYLLSLCLKLPLFSEVLGGGNHSFHLALVSFSMLYTPLSFLLGIGSSMISRKNEYQADAFAAQYGFGEALISGLKKLSVHSLSNLTPHAAYVFCYYSHPTMLQRENRLGEHANTNEA